MNKRNLEFLYEIGTLRHVPRTWRQFLNADFANVAEHTYRVMWISLLLAMQENHVSLEKVMLMALIHDIPESRAGDVHYISRQYTERNEELAIEDMVGGITGEAELLELYKEYERRECIEAKIVKDADTIDVDLELQEQAYRGFEGVRNAWHPNRKKNVATKLYTTSAKKLWPTIIKSNPHDWHLNGRNRHNGGDWKQKTEDPSEHVYTLLRTIPLGKVTTYGDIAAKVGIHSRQVGRILHENPDANINPCHRVVNAQGKLAPNYAFGGAEAQAKKLQEEGIEINNLKVNLTKHHVTL